LDPELPRPQQWEEALKLFVKEVIELDSTAFATLWPPLLADYNGPEGPPRPAAAPSPLATHFESDHQKWVRCWLTESHQAKQLYYGGSYDDNL
jgi:hypothetical protein